MTTISIEYRVANVLTTIDTSIDITITRTDTEQIFITAEPMTEDTVGKYTYTFTDPDDNLKYEYTIDIIHDSNPSEQTGNKYGPVTTAYANRDEAQTYMDKLLDSSPWESATEEDQVKAGPEATRRIDRLALAGVKNTEAQVLMFPRGDDTVVPGAILEAQYEISLALLDEVEEGDRSVVSRSFGGVRTTYNVDVPQPWLSAGILSKRAWEMLLPYMRKVREIKLNRES